RSLLGVFTARRKHSLKVNKEASDPNLGKVVLDQLGGSVQFGLVVGGLAFAISTECCQASVSRTIGMAHQENLRRFMQQNRHSHLLQNEVALEVIARRRESFCATGHDDHVRTQDLL